MMVDEQKKEVEEEKKKNKSSWIRISSSKAKLNEINFYSKV